MQWRKPIFHSLILFHPRFQQTLEDPGRAAQEAGIVAVEQSKTRVRMSQVKHSTLLDISGIRHTYSTQRLRQDFQQNPRWCLISWFKTPIPCRYSCPGSDSGRAAQQGAKDSTRLIPSSACPPGLATNIGPGAREAGNSLLVPQNRHF